MAAVESPAKLEEPVQSTRVYVGNLSYTCAWQDLKDHFRQCGEVVYADVFRDAQGRSRGCGVVEFSSAGEAARAIKELHDTKVKAFPRLIFVREDREDYAIKRRGGRRKRHGGEGGRQVYVGNLPYGTTWQQLKDLFNTATGNVVRADILVLPDGRPKGAGTVLLSSHTDAQRAVELLCNTQFNGRFLDVHLDRFAA